MHFKKDYEKWYGTKETKMDFKGFKACLAYLAIEYYKERMDGGGRDN